MRRPALFALPVVLVASAAVAGEALRVSPRDSLTEVGRRLASDPGITEVVLAGGIYRQTLDVPPLADARGIGSVPDPPQLLIRPAAGERVIFEGAVAIEGPRPVRGNPGIYSIPHRAENREPPKLWEPGRRVRYGLAADRDAVRRFSAAYLAYDDRIEFHTSDGLPPGDRVLLMSALDLGVRVRRPRVTVRDLEFRNFVARGKSSAGVRVDADHVTVERCRVSNASFGFVIVGHRNALLECTARDVGGGVYNVGEDNRVEACRFFKKRDAFMVPSYAQDDCGIQFYYPARGGVIRGNLSVGFGIGILIKSPTAPYVVEGNTLVGRGLVNGFIATAWHPDEIFRRNIVEGYRIPIQVPAAAEGKGVGGNCYWPTDDAGNRPLEPGSIVGDPGFVNPAAEDYRLDPRSACLAVTVAGEAGAVGADGGGAGADDGEPAGGAGAMIGAMEVAAPDTNNASTPRDWHVSPSGDDAAAGTTGEPLRTLQAAADRVAPGDTILLHPGIYSEAVTITRGGREGRPITLRALEKGTAILDGNRVIETPITIDGAPFVAIHDLEIRWFGSTGIDVRDAHDVTVSGCRIWNAHWGGTWPNGTGVHVRNSPRFVGERDILFSLERGFELLSSPRATIKHNTALANLYGGAVFRYSIEGSICRDNSFAFQGNDAILIEEAAGGLARLATFDCDYNNLGMTIQDQPPGVAFDRIVPRAIDRHLQAHSKAIVGYNEYPAGLRRFLTLKEWREFSARDLHSIVADPLYRSTATRDFRLEPASPNIGAGSGGATIGAEE